MLQLALFEIRKFKSSQAEAYATCALCESFEHK
jgi:hypothetical protein